MPNEAKIRTHVPFYISAFSCILAIAISIAIFTFIPALNYRQFITQTKIKKAFVADLTTLTPLHRPPPTAMQAPPPTTHTPPMGKKAPSAGSPGRFSMDLGLAGLGSGTGGVSIHSKSSMEDGTFEEGQTDTEAKLIRFVKPNYPDAAHSAGISGIEINTILTIGADGHVVDLVILDAPPRLGFEESIRTAIMQWIYEPATVGGAPVRIKIKQPFGF